MSRRLESRQNAIKGGFINIGLKNENHLSRKEYRIRFKEATDSQATGVTEKCTGEIVEIKGATPININESNSQVNSLRDVIPIDVLGHDKLKERIHVQYSNGYVTWVPTSMLKKRR